MRRATLLMRDAPISRGRKPEVAPGRTVETHQRGSWASAGLRRRRRLIEAVEMLETSICAALYLSDQWDSAAP